MVNSLRIRQQLSLWLLFSVFDLSKQKIEILDAGAGTGILAAAVVQKLYELGYVGKIYVTCYVRGISF